jgi:uncharacterized linocin/CFP29 family protein
MNTLSYVGRTDSNLTAEQGLYIESQVKEAARRNLKGRMLFGPAVRKIDSGAQSYKYNKLTHGSAAAFDYTYPGKTSIDSIDLQPTTVAMPNIHKEFQIGKLDLASSYLSGTPLNTTQAESCAYKVAWAEDALLINGWSQDGTTYEINGLYQAAGNSEATNLDWGAAANIATSIQNSLALLDADNINGPFNLTLNSTQFSQTLAVMANTAVTYRQWIKEQIGGQIISSPAMTAGTGMLTPVNPNGAFEYVVAEDITTKTAAQSLEEGEGLFGRVYVRGLPVIYDSNAICKLTTI